MLTVSVEVPLMVDGPQLLDEVEAVTGERPTVKRGGGVALLSFVGDVDPIVVVEVVRAHTPTDVDQLDVLVTKARQVWSGQGTFTQAQAQKILAGLVLVVARYLR